MVHEDSGPRRQPPRARSKRSSRISFTPKQRAHDGSKPMRRSNCGRRPMSDSPFNARSPQKMRKKVPKPPAAAGRLWTGTGAARPPTKGANNSAAASSIKGGRGGRGGGCCHPHIHLRRFRGLDFFVHSWGYWNGGQSTRTFPARGPPPRSYVLLATFLAPLLPNKNKSQNLSHTHAVGYHGPATYCVDRAARRAAHSISQATRSNALKQAFPPSIRASIDRPSDRSIEHGGAGPLGAFAALLSLSCGGGGNESS